MYEQVQKQAKPVSASSITPVHTNLLQRASASGAGHSFVPPIVRQVLGSTGKPLEPDTRVLMESWLGHDFAKVRVHAGVRPAESARAVNALAYTFGRDVVFGEERYAPRTIEGQRLLAHELTHVVQQGYRSAHSLTHLHEPPGHADASLEAEAEHMAQNVDTTGRSYALSQGVGVRIQKWDSPEHVQLGEGAGGPLSGFIVLECHDRDLPQRQQSPTTWPPTWQTLWASATPEQRRAITQGLTYGEVVALSGDFYTNLDALNRAPLREVIDLIPLIRSGASTTQLQQATGGRYLALAALNESHFSNVRAGHRNIEVWREMHTQAIQAAKQGNSNLARGLNASADHFLTDAFSGGHIRTPRATLMGSAMGNIESKVLHDLDNEYGVEVTNPRGDPPWIAYGDDMLADPRNRRNRELAQEAVRLSQQDIANALSQREAYPAPGPTTVFQAELLVPQPVDPTRDRWTGRTPVYARSGWQDVTVRDDDYTRTQHRIVREEGPGIASGFFTDDDQIRDWVRTQDLAAIGRQPANEKIRMINTLLNGSVGEDDMVAIERILSSVTSSAEMRTIDRVIAPRATEIGHGQRARLRLALNRRL